MEPRLRLVDVRKTFDGGAGVVEVLRGVTLDVLAGQALAVTGPSGSGKSTLLHVVSGLEPPSAGRVEIDGQSPHGRPEPEQAAFRNRTVGFVFQDSHLLPQYTVLENVLVPTWAQRAGDRAAQDARARQLLERVGLGHRLAHRPAELSGGERQRVAVARALVNRPSLLLCDEPTGSLDGASARTVADVLFELHHAERTVLLAVTHSLDLAARFGRRIELVDGRCVER